MLDNFIEQFGGLTEKYLFYDGEVELRYDVENHEYLLVKDGQLIPQPGVTTICHIIDKSNALIPWACKMMAEKLIKSVPLDVDGTVHLMPEDFAKLVNEAKSAHKEKLEEAADVGHLAHAWIESYINSVLASDEARKLEILAHFPDDERAKNCCIAALDWMQKHNVRWISTERKIYSREGQYAGTMDGLALVDSCDNPLCCSYKGQKVTFKDHKAIIDWKSSNYLYIEYLLQTAAYQSAYTEETGEHIDDRWIIRLGKTDGEFEPWYLPEESYLADRDTFMTALDLYNFMDMLNERMTGRKKWLKDEIKKSKAAEKEAALKIKCKSADKYKGVRKPTCNGGNPCETCIRIYEEAQAKKAIDKNVAALKSEFGGMIREL